MNRNSTSFSADLRRYFESQEYDAGNVLKYSQWVVREYLRAVRAAPVKGGGRGLIINHGMGMGKTITGAVIADDLQKEGYEVLMLGPKTLRANFDANVTKLRELTGDVGILAGGHRYFTLRAGNLIEQIVRSEVGDVRLAKAADTAVVSIESVLEGKVILIDEAHLFCNSVSHGREGSLRLYHAMMNAKNCFVFLFTGTMDINSPFESVPAFNLVAGREIFPEDEGLFKRWFGTPELLLENRGRLQNLTSGYLSWATAAEEPEFWPKKLPTKIVRLPMVGDQLGLYMGARFDEMREDSRNAKKRFKRADVFARGFHRDDAASSYRMASRIASNGTNKCSWLCDLVGANPDKNMLVHSTFLDRGGLRKAADALEAALNYRLFVVRADGVVTSGPEMLRGKKFEPQSDRGLTWQSVGEAPVFSDRYYFILSGETDPEVWAWTMAVLRDPRNRFGAFIHVLFVSNVGNLGLDLKNGRIVVEMSLGFHLEDFNQLMARYVRYMASVLLPPDMRDVQAYILISTAAWDQSAENEALKKEPSTDEHLLTFCMQKLKLNATHLEIIHSVSIECLAGVSAQPGLCRRCVPDGLALTTGNFSNDMLLPNACKEMGNEMDEVEWKSMDGREIGILSEPLRFFEREAGGKIRNIGPSDPLWKVLKKGK